MHVAFTYLSDTVFHTGQMFSRKYITGLYNWEKIEKKS